MLIEAISFIAIANALGIGGFLLLLAHFDQRRARS